MYKKHHTEDPSVIAALIRFRLAQEGVASGLLSPL